MSAAVLEQTPLAAPAEEAYLWRPFPGFQTRVLAAREFELFIGGGKGPGKSVLHVVRPLRQVHKSAFKALVLREHWMELQEILDRMNRIYKRHKLRPHWNGEEMRWQWPSGAIIRLGYCTRLEHTQNYQGHEWSTIDFDEFANVKDAAKIWSTLRAEVRCPDPTVMRSMCGSGNPGKAGHAFVRSYFVLPTEKGTRTHWEHFDIPGMGNVSLSRRFIPGTVRDNPIYARDPIYMATLHSLPKRLRSLLLDGDWDAAGGMALEELNEHRHFVPRFAPPAHWHTFAAFDWGFAHRWCFVLAAINEDGRIFILDTLWGHRNRPREIAERIVGLVGEERAGTLSIQSGWDCFHDEKVQNRQDNTPSIAEKFQEYHLILSKANIARVQGLTNMRHWFAWQGFGPHGEDVVPACLFMDTPGNRMLFEQLQAMVMDMEGNPEDVLKVDADPETGEGGDDGYDTCRYLLASRPFSPPSTFRNAPLSSFDPDVLAAEADRKRRHTSKPLAKRRSDRERVDFGGLG